MEFIGLYCRKQHRGEHQITHIILYTVIIYMLKADYLPLVTGIKLFYFNFITIIINLKLLFIIYIIFCYKSRIGQNL